MKQTKKTYIKDSHLVYDSIRYIVDSDYFNANFENWAECSGYTINGDNAVDCDGKVILTREQYIEIFEEHELFFFKEWMKSVNNPYDFFVTGRLGLWNCKPEIMPKVFHNLEDAIRACANGVDYIEVELCPKCIYFKGSHHDGTNYFEIRMMNKAGQNMYDNSPIYDEEEALLKIAKNKKFHHALYEEMFGFCL